MLSIATWNVNSLKIRAPQVLTWLEEYQPDILALQELKQDTDKVALEAYKALGYEAAVAGQPTYNGVAIFSRRPINQVVVNLPTFDDIQQRVLSVEIAGLKIVNVYVPNGQSVGSEKYAYKLAWLEGLRQYLQELSQGTLPVVVLGDFNIAPNDRDVHDPAAWAGQVLVSELERQAWRHLLGVGLVDALRQTDPDSQIFTWWDYRSMAFRRNHGLRIDHVLVSDSIAAHCMRCTVDKEARGHERPSDHAPLLLELDW